MRTSVILTVHNKGYLVRQVLSGICENAVAPLEVVIVLDGCEDDSEEVVSSFVVPGRHEFVVLVTPDVFETKANNAGLKRATGDYAIIVQDDMVIHEPAWDARILLPFQAWPDVFAVTCRAAHNWRRNPVAVDTMESPRRDDRWCDLLEACDVAEGQNLPRDVFAVRDTVNRGPLAINRADLESLGYLSEAFAPLDSDDHDLMYRMHAKLGKVCGAINLDWSSRPQWGGTRDAAVATRPFMFAAQNKNSRLLYARHAEAMRVCRVEARSLT